MAYVKSLRAIGLLGIFCLIGQPIAAHAADKVRISSLQSIDFGQLSGVGDRFVSLNVCAFSTSANRGYSITASGNGAGGSFALSSPVASLPFEVFWSDASSQSSGTSLVAGAPIGGFRSSATQNFCNSGPTSSASLVVVIRSAAIESARAGIYSGTLQIMLAPE